MKKILIIIFLNSTFCWSQHRQSDLNNYFLNGKVKTIHSILYDAIQINDSLIVKGEKIDKNKRFYRATERIISFNEFGFITEFKDNYRHEKNTYCDDTTLIYSILLDSNFNVTRKIIYKYNFNKKLIRELFYTSDNKNDYKMISKYKKGKLVKQRDKDLSEDYYYLSNYQYDNYGFINKIEEFENDSLTSICLFQNDSLGRKLKIETYNSTNKLKEIVTNEYNKSGNQTIKVKSNANGKTISKTVYTYDVEMNLIEENEFLEGRTCYKQYNMMGDEILSVNEITEDAIIVYTYTYDENNNWIKKLTYYNGKPIDIEEREIVYY